MLRRWIETQTFEPQTGAGGVQLVDARTAAYGRYDELFIIGLVDGEWPEQLGRSVFYPSSLLIPLDWPRDRDLLRAARATFRDLLALPVDRVALSSVSLENDAIVTPSSFLGGSRRYCAIARGLGRRPGGLCHPGGRDGPGRD